MKDYFAQPPSLETQITITMAFALKYFVVLLLLSLATQGNVIESLEAFCMFMPLVHVYNLNFQSSYHGVLNPDFGLDAV